MLMFAALLAAQSPQVNETPAVQQEILVIAGKLKKWTATYEVRGDKSVCRTKRSSGDADVDAIGCAAFKRCLTPLQPRITASDSASVPVRERKVMKNAIKADLGACVTQRRDRLISELAERRYQARQGQLN
jgi:hypothetical protein